jgi:purine nucleoside permease
MIKTLAKYWIAATSLLLLSCAQQEVSNQMNSPVDTHNRINQPISIKIVVVTMFEIGNDSGDAAGEFQLWRERQKLDKRFDFPQSFHDIFMNEETGVLSIVTGMGTSRAASAIMALGLDPRFDLTQSYWLVAGISGGDPAETSLGSAVWAEYLVDGDFAHEIDAREIPKDWPNGYFPLFSKGPNDPDSDGTQSEVFHLNSSLTEWAYQTSKSVVLEDDDELVEARARYINYPNAQLPPRVMKGDQLAAMTFWHGNLMNDWANQWVKYWTKGKGEFVTSAMEDTGTYQSLKYLTNAGKVDVNRLMVLRTVSNFTIPHSGISAAENLIKDGEDYSGMNAALESAYRVGSKVVETIVNNWPDYREQTPSVKKVK